MAAVPAPVPKERSVHWRTLEMWKVALSAVRKGGNIDLQIFDIEAELRARKRQLEKGILGDQFDWDADLEEAEINHARSLEIVRFDADSREAWVGFWQLRLQKNHDLVSTLLVDGLRNALLAHGAIALTCLTLFMTSGTEQFRPILLFAMLAAAVGISVLALGVMLLVEAVGNFTDRISSWLIARRSWRSITAIHRYGRRFHEKRARAATVLIYSSLCWFGLYVFICMLLLANVI